MQKLYHSISEISELLGEEQHTLRYWEKEFLELNPKKNRAGNRIYSDKDLFVIMMIKKFMREDKLSLKGSQEQLTKIMNTMQSENYKQLIENFSLKQISVKDEDLFTSPNNEQVLVDKRDIGNIYSLLKDIDAFLRQ
ncbi:MAG: MerR family transcriptional regulator [Bacteroidota bacterium]